MRRRAFPLCSHRVMRSSECVLPGAHAQSLLQLFASVIETGAMDLHRPHDAQQTACAALPSMTCSMVPTPAQAGHGIP